MRESFTHLVFTWFMVLAMGLSTPAGATGEEARYSVDVDRIYYHDNCGREIDYDFSSGTLDQYGRLPIASGAVLSVPPAEAGFTWHWEQPKRENQEATLHDGVYTLSVPQAAPMPARTPTASIIVDGDETDWDGVPLYLEDPETDAGTPWSPVSPGGDVRYLKLAYSPDGSRLNILVKLRAEADPALF